MNANPPTVLAAFDPHAFRYGASHAPLGETIVIVAVLVAMAAASALAVRHARRREHRQRRMSDQWQALSVMGELCPAGWQARVTVYGCGAPLPDDAPADARAAPLTPVELEWKQFDGQSGTIAVARRLWAPSIGSALQAMAGDRRTDLVLEQIEQAADSRVPLPIQSDTRSSRKRR
jgi:hypothetical protein